MRDSDRRALIRQAAHDTVAIYRRLAWAIERAKAWTDDGYPNGGTSGVRGGEADSLPLRKVLEGPDDVAARLFELERDLVMWVECGERITAFIAWTEKVARHEDDRPTLTCRHCERTIVDGWDPLAGRLDKPKAGLCTYHIRTEEGVRQVVDGGCYRPWEAERKARYRDRQRDVPTVPSAGVTVSVSVGPAVPGAGA